MSSQPTDTAAAPVEAQKPEEPKTQEPAAADAVQQNGKPAAGAGVDEESRDSTVPSGEEDDEENGHDDEEEEGEDDEAEEDEEEEAVQKNGKHPKVETNGAAKVGGG